MFSRPAKHEHPVGRWGPRLAVRSSALGSWGIRPMLQTGEAASKDQTSLFNELTPKWVGKGSMSSGSPAPAQPGLTHTGQTGHLFDKQTPDITACISDSSSNVFYQSGLAVSHRTV